MPPRRMLKRSTRPSRASSGSRSSGKTDVLVDDPFQRPNGSAWPYLKRPLINLWASPPDPRDDIGDYRSWGQMLIAHEFGHITHLTRPSRNTWTRRVWEAMPADIGPIALRAPRWVVEGYATFIEGRVTGSGRPHGAWRAAFLRQWAIEGQLPRYEYLDDWGAYAGGSFAYLAGSAFIEWLAERHGDSSLVDVWRRLSARQNRTFDEAFTGVYGESAAALYGRFTAELTMKSLDIARTMAAATNDTGAIVQRLSRSTGDPAISADGQRVAIVVRSADAPSRVVIWKTAPEPDTLRRRRDSLLLASGSRRRSRAIDLSASEDRAVHASRPRRRIVRIAALSARRPSAAVIAARRGATGRTSTISISGIPSDSSVRRLTRRASLREPDPAPDGRTAVATRCAGGWCSLVIVTLDDGQCLDAAQRERRALVLPSALFPRRKDGVGERSPQRHVAARDGRRRRAYAHADRSGRRRQSLRRGVGGSERHRRHVGQGRNRQHHSDEPGESRDTHALRRDRRRGRARAESKRRKRLVSVALFARLRPSPTDADEHDERAARRRHGAPRSRAADPTDADQLSTNAVSEPRRFGFAPRLFRWIPQPSLDADGASAALALVSRDVIGRSEVLLAGAYGDAASWRGGTLSGMWAGWGTDLRVTLFDAKQLLSKSRVSFSPRTNLDATLDRRPRSATNLRAQYDTWSWRARIGGSVGNARNSFVALDTITNTGYRAFVFRRRWRFGHATRNVGEPDRIAGSALR